MGFTYLYGNNWHQITRDERYFCSELFFEIKGKEQKFIKFLNEKHNTELNEKIEWEIGYEVCFYRDFIKEFGFKNNKKINTIKLKNNENVFSPKRTFDLCLFSNNDLIIIEAKAQKGFESKQNNEFKKDKNDIELLFKDRHSDVNIKLFALASDIYYNNINNRKSKTLDLFDAKISWMDIYNGFSKNKNFIRANNIYKK